MHKKGNLFFVGGAKGVGKTTVTGAVCLELALERVETGKIVFEYITSGVKVPLNDYICGKLLEFSGNRLVDTHFVAYPNHEDPSYSFTRGLDTCHLKNIARFNNVHLCHVVLSPEMLLERRLRDGKKRITSIKHVKEELQLSYRACEIYSKELGCVPYVVENACPVQAKELLSCWIRPIISGQQ